MSWKKIILEDSSQAIGLTTPLTIVKNKISLESGSGTTFLANIGGDTPLVEGKVLSYNYNGGSGYMEWIDVVDSASFVVTSAHIQNLTIINEDISETADIATSKLSGPITAISGHGTKALALLDTINAQALIDNDMIKAAHLDVASEVAGQVLTYTGAGSGFNWVDANVTETNLKAKLALLATATIGAATSTITIGDDLVVTGNLEVQGSTTIIESTTTQLLDPTLQLNVLAGQTAFGTGNSAIIFGKSGLSKNSGKIINDSSAFHFTDVNGEPNTPAGSDTVVLGDYKDLKFNSAYFAPQATAPVGAAVPGGMYYDSVLDAFYLFTNA
jgi:hypothetical protein